MLYLYDEQANLLVLGISAVGVLVDVWKVLHPASGLLSDWTLCVRFKE